jgi:hypothetical protein
MSKDNGQRRRSSVVNVCGHCSGAAMSTSVQHSHARCYSPDSYPCACAQNGHKLTPEIAAVMASYCHTTIDTVYKKHGRKRRVLSEERKEQLRAQLVHARAKKGVTS